MITANEICQKCGVILTDENRSKPYKHSCQDCVNKIYRDKRNKNDNPTEFEKIAKDLPDETKALVSLYEALYYEPNTTLETRLMILGKVQKIMRI